MHSKQLDTTELLESIFTFGEGDFYGLISFDSEGQILKANEYIASMLECDAKALISRQIEEFFPVFKTFQAEMNAIKFSGEERYFNTQGVQKWAQISIKQISNDPVVKVVLAFDINDQKEKARHLQFKLFAETMTKAKSELAHNLGNTLNSMVSTQIVLEKGVSGIQELSDYMGRWLKERDQSLLDNHQNCLEFVSAVEKAMREHLTQNVRSSLAVLDADIKTLVEGLQVEEITTVTLTDEEVNIYNLIQSLIRSTDAYCKENRVKIELEDSHTKILVKTSRNLLHQAILNLIKNAVEALEDVEGSKKIRIRTLAEADHGLSICIEDNGPGILPENKDKIFQHGFTTKKCGTGQGLHSTANYLNQYGGSITVDSKPGQGTAFEIHFPPKLVTWL